jgi:hypothetical protein
LDRVVSSRADEHHGQVVNIDDATVRCRAAMDPDMSLLRARGEAAS